MQADLCATAEAHSKWTRYNRLRTELDGLRHALEATNGEVNLIPFAFLNRHKEKHDIGADGEMLRVVGDDEGVELIQCRAARLQVLRYELNDVSTQ